VTDVDGDDVFVDPHFDSMPNDLRGTFNWDPTDDHYLLDILHALVSGSITLETDDPDPLGSRVWTVGCSLRSILRRSNRTFTGTIDTIGWR
jgi:hypothetical protein